MDVKGTANVESDGREDGSRERETKSDIVRCLGIAWDSNV